MDTRPSVCHPTSKKINFLKDVAFPKKRGVLSSRPSRWPTSSSRSTTPTSRPVRHIKTDDVHLTSRSARRSRSFPRHPPASSPPCPPSPFPSRHAEVTRDQRSRTTRKPDDGARRDFACTSTWPHDGALPKHGAPRAATTENDARQWPRGNTTKTYQNLPRQTSYEAQLRLVCPVLTKTYQALFLSTNARIPLQI